MTISICYSKRIKQRSSDSLRSDYVPNSCDVISLIYGRRLVEVHVVKANSDYLASAWFNHMDDVAFSDHDSSSDYGCNVEHYRILD